MGIRPTRILLIALLTSSVAAPAIADDIKGALREFGLIGSWSRNCSNSNEGRAVFAIPLDGGPTAMVRDHRAILITTVYDITEAKMLSADQINVGLHPTKITRSDGTAASQHDYDNIHLVFKKAAEKIELISMGIDGLAPPIERANFFERCTD